MGVSGYSYDMSNFQGTLIESENSGDNKNSQNMGLIFAVISLVLIIGSFFAGIGISNTRIDATWKLANFNSIESNKDFQFSTTGTSECDENATDGCVVFRFVSKYDCEQATGLVSLVNSEAKSIASISSAKSNIKRGVPFEMSFNLPANSEDVADTTLLDVRCFR